MRETKFRCFVKKTGMMVYGVEQMYDGLGEMRCVDKNGKVSLRDPHNVLIDFCTSFGAFLGYYDAEDGQEYAPPDTIELMQYTGLKDANGNEIYDGDVLEHESERPHRLRVLVEWETQEWCEDGFYTGYLFRGTTDQYTIIGNIHQNPELMEEMEK